MKTPEGYYLLTEGKIKKGDKIYDPLGNTWRDCDATVGEDVKAVKGWVFIRKGFRGWAVKLLGSKRLETFLRNSVLDAGYELVTDQEHGDYFGTSDGLRFEYFLSMENVITIDEAIQWFIDNPRKQLIIQEFEVINKDNTVDIGCVKDIPKNNIFKCREYLKTLNTLIEVPDRTVFKYRGHTFTYGQLKRLADFID